MFRRKKLNKSGTTTANVSHNAAIALMRRSVRIFSYGLAFLLFNVVRPILLCRVGATQTEKSGNATGRTIFSAAGVQKVFSAVRISAAKNPAPVYVVSKTVDLYRFQAGENEDKNFLFVRSGKAG